MLVSLMILGSGISLAMTPATESIMGSLPLAKAGVGSAMNDTTRQIGGALGVAILGSVFASAYTAALAPAAAGLPATLASAADNSVGAAIAIGQQMGGVTGSAFVTAAKESFIHAMDVGLLVGVAVVLIGVVVALGWLPNRPQTSEEIELQVDRGEGGLAPVVERVEA